MLSPPKHTRSLSRFHCNANVSGSMQIRAERGNAQQSKAPMATSYWRCVQHRRHSSAERITAWQCSAVRSVAMQRSAVQSKAPRASSFWRCVQHRRQGNALHCMAAQRTAWQRSELHSMARQRTAQHRRAKRQGHQAFGGVFSTEGTAEQRSAGQGSAGQGRAKRQGQPVLAGVFSTKTITKVGEASSSRNRHDNAFTVREVHWRQPSSPR